MARFNLIAGGGYFDIENDSTLYSLIDFRGLDPSGPSPPNLVPFIDTDYFVFEYGDEASGERHIDAQYWSSTEYGSTTMGGNQPNPDRHNRGSRAAIRGRASTGTR